MDAGVTFVNNALERYEKNLKIREAGKYIGIPYPFPKLEKSLCGIQKGQFIGLTAGTKNSKSKFTRFTFIYNTYKFAKKTGYNVKIIYFPLEDSPDQIMDNMISHYLYELYTIRISAAELSSKSEKPLSRDILKKINESKVFFSELFDYLYIVSDVSNPYGIYFVCERFAEKYGNVIKEKIEGFDNPILKTYTPHSDLHTIIIIDNLSNITKDKYHKEDWDAMGDLTRNIIRKKLCKIFNFTVVLVQQQAQASESLQFTNTGRNIIEKLEPSITNLADYKNSSRDFTILLSLFNPFAFKIDNYYGYDIKILGDSFRALSVLRQNEGESMITTGLFFDGLTESFYELPIPVLDSREYQEKIEKWYLYLKKIKKR